MRFHHVITLVLIVLVFIAYALFLADQIALLRLGNTIAVPFREYRP